MARGLSNLQKWMLVRALENHESMPDSDRCLDLFRNEVRGDYYGMEVKDGVQVLWFNVDHRTHGGEDWRSYSFTKERRTRIYKHVFKSADQRRCFLRNRVWDCFQKSSIPNYEAVNLSISRAIDRLARRGLVVGGYTHGFNLTDKGCEQAKLLATLPDAFAPRVANKLTATPVDASSREGSR